MSVRRVTMFAASIFFAGMTVGAYFAPLSPVRCGEQLTGGRAFVWVCRW